MHRHATSSCPISTTERGLSAEARAYCTEHRGPRLAPHDRGAETRNAFETVLPWSMVVPWVALGIAIGHRASMGSTGHGNGRYKTGTLAPVACTVLSVCTAVRDLSTTTCHVNSTRQLELRPPPGSGSGTVGGRDARPVTDPVLLHRTTVNLRVQRCSACQLQPFISTRSNSYGIRTGGRASWRPRNCFSYLARRRTSIEKVE